jgi:hypothetical protein
MTQHQLPQLNLQLLQQKIQYYYRQQQCMKQKQQSPRKISTRNNRVRVLSTGFFTVLLLFRWSSCSSSSTGSDAITLGVMAYQPFTTIKNIQIPPRKSNNHCWNSLQKPSPASSSSSQHQLHMHMGHSHSHHEHLHSDDTVGTAALIPYQQRPFPFSNIIRTRRFIAMIIFCTIVAILGPSIFVDRSVISSSSSIPGTRHVATTPSPTKLSTRLLTFVMTSMVITVAEPIRNSIQTTIERIRSIGEGISKHSTPITASYLFQNTNDADRITLLGYVVY